MEALAIFNPGTAANVAAVSLGTVAPSSSDDVVLRVANTSDIYSAHIVTVAVGGNNQAQLHLSINGDDFYPQVTVGDIPPGGLSIPFTLRRVTPYNSLGGCTATLTATPTAWTNPTDTSTSDDVPLDTE